jgi:hypothetical protein
MIMGWIQSFSVILFILYLFRFHFPVDVSYGPIYTVHPTPSPFLDWLLVCEKNHSGTAPPDQVSERFLLD